jgi:hypothetical protein
LGGLAQPPNGSVGLGAGKKRREESSFSEEKEAKRLLFVLSRTL